MKTNRVWFQSTYIDKASQGLYRTVGYAVDPVSDNRIIIFVPIVSAVIHSDPFYMDESDFLDKFEYVGC